MSKLIYFKRYLYLVDRLRSRPCSFVEIQKYILLKLEQEDIDTTFEYSIRTFERDRKDIESLFGVIINFDRKEKKYIIDEEEIEDQSIVRMIDAFSIHQALQEGNKLSPSIFLEKRKSLGTEHIHGVIYAIHNRFKLQFTYQKHWEIFATQREVYPLAVKESQNRWYLIALDKKDEEVKTFGLDRISNLKITDVKCKPFTFNVEKEFRNTFGVLRDAPAEKVILEFSKMQGEYIKTFPLHESQQIIEENEDKIVFELYVNLTYDFLMEILKYADNVKVLAPDILILKLKDKINQMINLYH